MFSENEWKDSRMKRECDAAYQNKSQLLEASAWKEGQNLMIILI